MKKADRECEFPRLVAPVEKFARVKTILVEPKYSGNIGQVARVLRNFGFSRLLLVKPRCRVDAEAEKMAVGAEDLLDTIEVFDSLEQAVTGSRIVIGTTRRRGVQRRNMLEPKTMAELLIPVLQVGDASIVFGPEDRGLSNEDLACCHWLATIPTVSSKPSFNVSHAVAIFLYEVALHLLFPLPRNMAKHENLEAMFDHLQEFLQYIGFIHEADPARMMLFVRQMFFRAGLSEREVRTIRGILRQAFWKMNHPDTPDNG